MSTGSRKMVDIFTDGACRGNPGPGGWGALLRCGAEDKTIRGSEALTTNNRMEMMAVIKALQSLKNSCDVNLSTDSQYVVKGITEWLPGWKKRGWKTASKQPVKNADLWREIDELANQHRITWHWVRGHSGHTENELADQLANLAIDQM